MGAPLQTHCKYGHPFAGDNLILRQRVHRAKYVKDDGTVSHYESVRTERICRACRNRWTAESTKRHKQQANRNAMRRYWKKKAQNIQG